MTTSHYSDVWRALAEVVPARIAWVTAEGEMWSFGRWAREAAAFADALRVRGVQAGDRVALLLHNRPEFLVALFACLACGFTPVPLNFRLRAGEVAALLDDSGAVALVYDGSLSAEVHAAVADAINAPVLVQVGRDGEGRAQGEPWSALVSANATLPDHSPPGGELWIYTGGTTGPPKGVRWDVVDLFIAQQHSAYTLSSHLIPADLEEATRIAVDDGSMVTLPLAPLMHGTALCTSMNTLLLGGTVLLTGSPSLDAGRALPMAVEHRATRLVVAGDAVALPLVDAAERSGTRLSSVQTVTSSGMRLSADTKRRLHALGDLTIVDILASSEGGGFATTTTRSADDLPGQPRLFPTAVVLDEDLEQVQDMPGRMGILAQRGRLPLGYHADPEKTEAIFPTIGGVRHVVPGDWVRVLPDRHVEFLGRRSGVINTGGEKVYPLEVERALLSHPDVTDACVLGVPDPRFGEVVAAVVVGSASLADSELIAHLEPVLAGYKKPRRILLVSSLDRSPTGKIDERRWRREIVARHSTPWSPRPQTEGESL